MAKPAPYPQFDRSRLRLEPLANRKHDVPLKNILPLDALVPAFNHPDFPRLVEAVAAAHKAGRPVIVMLGAHVIKKGLSRFLIEMMERGIITHIAGNGACAIHDFELATAGGTSEDVGRYIRDGRFGLWQDTGRINDIVTQGAAEGLGFGESVGRWLEREKAPHRDVSVFAAGYRLRVPVTVHVGIGYDIIHEHPNCNGAAMGDASYRDFLIYAAAVEKLEGGVLLNFGSAVMGPEVYLKALSMSRNVAAAEGRSIRHFTTAVFDLQDLPETYHTEMPKAEAHYFYRPWKTILVRTVADGGQSYYFKGWHEVTIPNLLRGVMAQM